MNEYYRIGKKFRVDGVGRVLVEKVRCQYQQVEDEVCRLCDGKLKFDNGKISCGWTEVNYFWQPYFEEDNDSSN